MTEAPIRRGDQDTDTERKDHEEGVRRRTSTIQGEMLQKESSLQTPLSQTSSFQNCEKINLYCLGLKNNLKFK